MEGDEDVSEDAEEGLHLKRVYDANGSRVWALSLNRS